MDDKTIRLNDSAKRLILAQSTVSFLTYAGSTPFLLGAVLLKTGVAGQNLSFDIQHLLSVYGLVIGSFMAGTLWGQQVNIHNVWQNYLFICSNVIALALWMAFILFSFTNLMIAYVSAFVVLLLIDHQLSKSGISNSAYFKLRFRVTLIVILAIGVAAFSG